MKKTLCIAILCAASWSFAEGIEMTNILATRIEATTFSSIVVAGTNDDAIVGGGTILHYDQYRTVTIYTWGIGTTGWFVNVLLDYGTNTLIAFGTNTANVATVHTGIVIRAGVPNVVINPGQSVWAGGDNGDVSGTNNIFTYGGITLTNASMSTAMTRFNVSGQSWLQNIGLLVGSNTLIVVGSNIVGDISCTTNIVVGNLQNIANYRGQGYMCNTGAVGTTAIKIAYGHLNEHTLDTNATHIVPFIPTKVIVTVFDNDPNTLYVSTGTNAIFYGWGISVRGKTNKFTTAVAPKRVTDGKCLEIDGPLTELYLIGSAAGTSYEVYSTER
jgi:hypothetical protein